MRDIEKKKKENDSKILNHLKVKHQLNVSSHLSLVNYLQFSHWTSCDVQVNVNCFDLDSVEQICYINDI